jgi:hypothetical protein
VLVGLVITVKQQLTLGAAKKLCRYAHTAYLWGNHNFAFPKNFSLPFLLHLTLNFQTFYSKKKKKKKDIRSLLKKFCNLFRKFLFLISSYYTFRGVTPNHPLIHSPLFITVNTVEFSYNYFLGISKMSKF